MKVTYFISRSSLKGELVALDFRRIDLLMPLPPGESDPQLVLQVADRISFRVFLGTTEVIPDYTTVWLFRERLIKNGKLGAIWEEFLIQLNTKGYEVKKGVIQDATFITSDPGHAKSDVPRGDKAKTRLIQI